MHGTGCTLSAAITAGLARAATGQAPTAVPDIVVEALDFVQRAIAEAPEIGQGARPLNHQVRPRVIR